MEKETDKLKYQRKEAVDLLATTITDLDELTDVDQLNGVEGLKLDAETKGLIEEAKKLIIESTGKKSEGAAEPWPATSEADRAEVHKKQKEVIREYLDASSTLDFDDMLGRNGKPGRLQKDYAKAIKTEAYKNLIKTVEMLDGIDLEQLTKDEAGEIRFDQFTKIKFVLKLKDLVTRLDKAYQDVLTSPQFSQLDEATKVALLQKSIAMKKKRNLLFKKTFATIDYLNRIPNFRESLIKADQVFKKQGSARGAKAIQTEVEKSPNREAVRTGAGLPDDLRVKYQMINGYNMKGNNLFDLIDTPKVYTNMDNDVKWLMKQRDQLKEIVKNFDAIKSKDELNNAMDSVKEVMNDRFSSKKNFLEKWDPEPSEYYKALEFIDSFRDMFIALTDKLSSQIVAKITNNNQEFMGDESLKLLLDYYNSLSTIMERLDMQQERFLNDLTVPVYTIPPDEMKMKDLVVLPGLNHWYSLNAVYSAKGTRSRVDWGTWGSWATGSALSKNPDIPLPELRNEGKKAQEAFLKKRKDDFSEARATRPFFIDQAYNAVLGKDTVPGLPTSK